jgi:sec-independent protein translocase protein TatA
MAFIGPWEIALILAIVLILFGPKKLPELAKGLGDAIRQYRMASEGGGGLIPDTAPQPYAPAPVATTQSRSTDVLIETAKNLGIQTEGKTMDQISKEIVEISAKKN